MSRCFWTYPSLEGLLRLVGQSLEGLSREQEDCALSTIYAIALLRGSFGKLARYFRPAERKGLAYLRSLSSTAKWEAILQRLIPLNEKI